MSTRIARVRMLEIVRGAWGVALLVAPEQVLARIDRTPPDRRSIVVARILGARHLSQALLSGVAPSPLVLAMGTWVDAAHAATAVGLAAVDPSRARSALADAGVASAWAFAGYRDLGTGTAPRPGHDLRRDGLARLVLRQVPGGPTLLERAE